MTTSDLHQLLALAAKAPQGPYNCTVGSWFDEDGCKHPIILGPDLECQVTRIDTDYVNEKGLAEFIAACSPEKIREIVTELLATREEIERLTEALDWIGHQPAMEYAPHIADKVMEMIGRGNDDR